VNDLLQLAVNAHGGLRRWEQISRFRAAASITGALWDLKGKPGLLGNVALEGETCGQRLKITSFPRPGQYATWEPYTALNEKAKIFMATSSPLVVTKRPARSGGCAKRSRTASSSAATSNSTRVPGSVPPTDLIPCPLR
jgi:hypothetical protein